MAYVYFSPHPSMPVVVELGDNVLRGAEAIINGPSIVVHDPDGGPKDATVYLMTDAHVELFKARRVEDEEEEE